MSGVGSMLYQTLVRHAEGGARVTKVTLPEDLYFEFSADEATRHMMKTLKVEVVIGAVKEPRFETGEHK